MSSKYGKTNTQIKVDKAIFWEFKKESDRKEQTLPEALEHAMTLYNEEAKRGQNE